MAYSISSVEIFTHTHENTLSVCPMNFAPQKQDTLRDVKNTRSKYLPRKRLRAKKALGSNEATAGKGVECIDIGTPQERKQCTCQESRVYDCEHQIFCPDFSQKFLENLKTLFRYATKNVR